MTTIVLDLWLALSDVDRDADTLILLGKRHFIKLSLAANQALGMTRAEIPLKVGQRTFPKSLRAPEPAFYLWHAAPMRLEDELDMARVWWASDQGLRPWEALSPPGRFEPPLEDLLSTTP